MKVRERERDKEKDGVPRKEKLEAPPIAAAMLPDSESKHGRASSPSTTAEGELKRKDRPPRPKEKAPAGKPAARPGDREPEKVLASATKEHAPSPPAEKVLYDNRIKRKNVLALNEKVAAIREYEKMPVYKRIGRLFNCSPDQIKRIVQQKDSIMKQWEQRTRRFQDARTLEMKVVRVSMLGKAVYDWIRRMMYYKDFMITDGLIQKMALQFKSAMGLQPFFPHPEWCNKFRQTYSIPENDSKLLNIAYTQGYSVQIKDIVKDVLNECTPDVVERRDGHDSDGELGHGDSSSTDDEDADVDVDGVGDIEHYDENGNDNSEAPPPAKATPAKQPDRIRVKRSAALLSPVGAPPAALPPGQSGNQGKVALRLKMPLHKLLLPLPQNGNMQQVLVATPITTVAPLKGAALPPGVLQTANVAATAAPGGASVATASTPMTMTIIPLATIAAQSQNSPSATAAGGGPASALALGQSAGSGGDKLPLSVMPVPLKDIKQEIKEEPAELVEVKQEYISEDEDGFAMAGCDDSSFAPDSFHLGEPVADDALLDGRLTDDSFASGRPASARSASLTSSPPDTPRHDDFENVSLAELRELMQKKAAAAANNNNNNNNNNSSGTRSLLLSKKRPANAAREAVAAAEPQRMPSPPAAAVPASFQPVKMPPPPPLSPASMLPMPPLTRAPSPPEGSARRLSPEPMRKRLKAEADDGLRPIETYTQARRYIKLLERFALEKESFRLVGLLTRADEVLRDLDGYGNTDSD